MPSLKKLLATESNVLTLDALPTLYPRKKFHMVNPFAPGDFAKKRVLKLVKWFSGHCRAIKSKPVYRSYTSRPSDPDAKYQLAKFGHVQKAKF